MITVANFYVIITVNLKNMNKNTEEKQMTIPQIKPLAEKMIWVCLALITLYLIMTVAYVNFSSEPMRIFIAFEMLESALLATLLSLGGGILLDFEIRNSDKNKS